jgi:hypothetical protein
MAVLYRLFEFAQSASKRLTPGQVTALFDTGLSVKRVELALGALERRKLVYTAYSTVRAPESDITEAGYRGVERGLADTDGFYFNYHRLGDNWLTRNDEDSFGVPAANRIVPLNHNEPEYLQIDEQLTKLTLAVDGDNELGPEDKSRISIGLNAAKALWQGLEIKAVQLKIGVLMAVEDVKPTATNKFYEILVDGLIELIKAFARRLGINLDLF